MGHLATKQVSHSATSNAKLMVMSEEFWSKMCYSKTVTNLLNMAERVSSSGVSNALNSGVSNIVLGSRVSQPLHRFLFTNYT